MSMLDKKGIFVSERVVDERLSALETPRGASRLTPKEQEAVRIKESANLVIEYVLGAKYDLNSLSVNTLYAALRSEDRMAVSAAASVISQRKPKDGLEHLLKALNHDPLINLPVVEAIGAYEISATYAIPKLMSLVRNDMPENLATRLIDALAKMRSNNAYGAISEMTKFPQKEVAAYARAALKRFT